MIYTKQNDINMLAIIDKVCIGHKINISMSRFRSHSINSEPTATSTTSKLTTAIAVGEPLWP
jgi:hypothetical protein